MTRLVRELGELERSVPTVLTVGAFDGVHRGHQYLIRQVVERARSLGCASLVLTFDPRPEVVLRPGSAQLTDGAEKARVISALGADTLVVMPFTLEVSRIPAQEFLQSLCERINLVEFWTGADFGFGHKRQGTVDMLIAAGQREGYAVHVVSRQQLGDAPISSTTIRTLVGQGQVEKATELLGHYLSFSGPVVKGYGRGMEMGYPTANVQPPPAQQLPGTGIYAGYLRLDETPLPSALSVGYNPVFGNTELSVEAHVLDFRGELHDRLVGLDFVARIRDERNFESVDALIAEMARDVDKARRILDRSRRPEELLAATASS